MTLEDGSSSGADRARAVSSVIAVVLMVAITVIMAAVIGVYGLGFGEQTREDAPRIAWEHETYVNDSGNLDRVEIVHNGGGELDLDRVEVRIGGTNASTVTDPAFNDPFGTMTAGDSFDFDWNGGAPTNASGTEITVVWYGEERQETTVIHTYELEAESA